MLFCLAAGGVILSTLIERPIRASLGLGLVATGVPVYFFCNKFRTTTADELPALPDVGLWGMIQTFQLIQHLAAETASMRRDGSYRVS